MKDIVIVIGSNSFSGSSFVSHCLHRGHQVIGLSRSEEPSQAFLPYKWLDKELMSRFSFSQMDLNHDHEKILQVIADSGARYVVNFAAQSMVGQSWDEPQDWFQTNAVATTNLFNGLSKNKALRKYIHISTPECYGSCEGMVTEHYTFMPSTPYAASRAAGDLSLLTYIRQKNLPAVITRAANVYGPGQGLYRIIPKAILSIMNQKSIPLHGGGLSERSFIHIDDVCDATYNLFESGIVGESYHISGKDTVTIKTLVEMICNQLRVSFNSSVELAPDRLGKDQAYLLDSEKIRKLTGWSPKVDLDAGLGEVISWIRQNYQSLKNMSLDYHHKP